MRVALILSFNSMSRLGVECTGREEPNADTQAGWFSEMTLSEVAKTEAFRGTGRILNTTEDRQVGKSVQNNKNALK